jgi:hypothetical protein
MDGQKKGSSFAKKVAFYEAKKVRSTNSGIV